MTSAVNLFLFLSLLKAIFDQRNIPAAFVIYDYVPHLYIFLRVNFVRFKSDLQISKWHSNHGWLKKKEKKRATFCNSRCVLVVKMFSTAYQL